MNSMNKIENSTGIVILAAGKGTRMKSDLPKVLHQINGRPMVHYVVEAARQVVGQNIVLVIGHQREKVRESFRNEKSLSFAIQEPQLGTGHAVQSALPWLASKIERVVILCGDVPLLKAATIRSLLEAHVENGRDITLLAVTLEEPTGYGRVLMDAEGRLTEIVEESDATPVQKEIKLINTGIYCINTALLSDYLDQIKANNTQGEFYLTDIIGVGSDRKCKMGVLIGENWKEFVGVNTIADLMEAESLLAAREGKKP